MALELRHVSVRAGSAVLIEGVDLRLKAGTLTVILGANGAGKSTAMAALAGDLQPHSGAALLDGRPLASFSAIALARRRAVVLQHAPLHFAMCVHDILALSRTPFARSMQRGEGAEERALSALALSSLAGRDYTTLSGGERQRVQIARALAQLWHCNGDNGPGYLLMDEPTAHLDLKHQIIALEAARRFTDDGGATLCILHDVGLAREFADEAVLMKGGGVIASGAPAELLSTAMIAEVYGITDQRARRFALH